VVSTPVHAEMLHVMLIVPLHHARAKDLSQAGCKNVEHAAVSKPLQIELYCEDIMHSRSVLDSLHVGESRI
jgi:hypothetical protein